MTEFGCLGFGNLPSALFCGLFAKGALEPSQLTVYDPSELATERAVRMGCRVAPSLAALCAECRTLVLAVKPVVFRALAEELQSVTKSYGRVLSVMAGVSMAEIQSATDKETMRLIPTLAAAGGDDILAVCGADLADIKQMLRSIGTVMETTEENLPLITVAASCGLGFAAKVLAEYQEAVKRLGFSDEEAAQITGTTFRNAAQMAPYAPLASKVATKGGVTEKGLSAMEANGLGSLFDKAFNAAKH